MWKNVIIVVISCLSTAQLVTIIIVVCTCAIMKVITWA